jgi:calpain-15
LYGIYLCHDGEFV